MKKSISLIAVSLAILGQHLSAQTVQNSDALLNNGSSTSLNYSALNTVTGTQILAKNSPHNSMWFMGADPYGVTQGSGAIDMSYNGSGTAQWSVNLTGLKNTNVSAFPFLGFGGDVFGFNNGNQGLTFPVALPSLNSYEHRTELQSYGSDQQQRGRADGSVVIAQLRRTAAAPPGLSKSKYCPISRIPTGLLPLISKPISIPCTLNGVQTTLSFREYASGNKTGAGSDILFFPESGDGLASADLQFDTATLLKAAAATAGVSNWYLPGYNIGTEFGLSSSADFNFTLTQFAVTESVPEPATLVLLGGAVGLAAFEAAETSHVKYWGKTVWSEGLCLSALSLAFTVDDL